MPVSRTDSTTTSPPLVRFTDLVEQPNGTLLTTLTLPRPQSFEVNTIVKRNQNESVSGKVETLTYFERDEIMIRWEWLDESMVALLRRLWISTQDGTPFFFKRHSAMTNGWPNTSTNWRIHDNEWTVRWSPNHAVQKYALNQGISRRYPMAWTLSEVL
jgi:hypothetical protein